MDGKKKMETWNKNNKEKKNVGNERRQSGTGMEEGCQQLVVLRQGRQQQTFLKSVIIVDLRGRGRKEIRLKQNK